MDNIQNRVNGNMFFPHPAKSNCLLGVYWVPLSVMKVKRFFSLSVLVIVLLMSYAWLIEPNRLVIRRVVVKDSVLARAWQGLTIVHLSDTHIENIGARESRLLKAVMELSPDLIVVSGDLKQWTADPGPAQQFVSQLSAPLGVYGVLGDADQVLHNQKGCAFCHPDGRYHERLAHPVILHNEMRRVVAPGGTIAIAGVGFEEEVSDQWLRQLQAESRQNHEPLLIVSHRSERWKDATFPVHSLWLCGDTHGGQIWMPDWMWRWIPYKPDPQHMGGVYDDGLGSWLIVNRGIGMTARVPFRLGVPPELVVITFAESDGGMSQ